ncbi:hypothetical protein FEM03_22105 [Phragmitibacter flavus]|uniref:Uncharacterized protein n=1 Tax=Phragmitibacter flavus TaxID=2576071 RepID=A0A5R8K826_9BACT|nr:hypothetical protein [Phragmitibacter flavus]TLD68504.1 hypothetical protein FEM03_22105 [Phragmitibacter flavus]
MATSTLEYLRRESYVPLWTANAGFNQAVTKLATLTSNIASLGDLQRTARAGQRLSKENLSEQMIVATLAVSGIVAAYAHEAGNIPLRERFGFPRTYLASLKDGERSAAALNLYTEAAALFADQTTTPPPAGQPSLAGFGMTAALLSAMESAVTQYDLMKDAPRGAQVSISQSTDAVEAAFKKLDDHFEWSLDKLMQQFVIAEPVFFQGYRNARAILDIGVRHDPDEEPNPTPPLTPPPTP